MSTAKHTPGPWSIFDGYWPGIEAHGCSIVTYGEPEDDSGVRGDTDEQALANARLIAAAPDLVAALRGAIEVIESVNWLAFSAEMRRKFDAARAALTKAGCTDD